MRWFENIKNIAIVVLVMTAFVQFAIIMSHHYTGINIFFQSFSAQTDEETTHMYVEDRIAIESIRIADGQNRYRDMDPKSSEFAQMQMVVKEVLKRSASTSALRVSEAVWRESFQQKHVMVEYFFDVPLPFLVDYEDRYRTSLLPQRIWKILFVFEDDGMDVLVCNQSTYYRILREDHSIEQLFVGLQTASLFSFDRYASFYEQRTYMPSLLMRQSDVFARDDVKIYELRERTFPLALTVIPEVLADIAEADNVLALNPLKEAFFGVTKDRYTSSLDRNQIAYMSNLENIFTFSKLGRITYNYYGKKVESQRGDVGLAYQRALSMLSNFLRLVDDKTHASVYLTGIDDTNAGRYIFYFDYMVNRNQPVLVAQGQGRQEVTHAFAIEADQHNVLSATGLIRNIYLDMNTLQRKKDDTIEHIASLSTDIDIGLIIKNYIGYLMVENAGNSFLNPASFLYGTNGVAGVNLPEAQEVEE